ncbi:MAG: formate dehydrogenase accessory sulfurtransferase FdhD [Deltaproteobacteria bacterium]|nr:formate dehydrogenase accessory sulfurtransferase FdhD [Deltaproteobacteria bacterium]
MNMNVTGSTDRQKKRGITGSFHHGPFPVLRCYKGDCFFSEHELIEEEPLLIRVENNPYSMFMRTPGDEICHAAGFCLSEGIIERSDDLASVGYCEDTNPNVVDVRLTPTRCKQVAALLTRKVSISQTSCGNCGKDLVEEICQDISPITDDIHIKLKDALGIIEKLSELQILRKKTRGSHGVMLLDAWLQPISFAEDVGRHNALDKAIGKLFMQNILTDAHIGVLSSRISYEMVQKAARARLSILLSISRPTTLAVRLGKSLNLTLACRARKSELIIFCGENRILRK